MASRRLLIALAPVWICSLGVALASWTASGTFLYVDREFDQSGFTGAEPARPIRLATVEVRDAGAKGGSALLATGATDENGNFSIVVNDRKTRTVYVRAVTVSTGIPGLNLRVEAVLQPKDPYAVASPEVPGHSPGTDVDFGTVLAPIGGGGEPFNIYDVALRSVDFFAALDGSRPGSSDLLKLEWAPDSGNVVSDYDYGSERVHVGDVSGYNDTVIAHETGHYAFQLVSATDSPGGTHHLTDCNQDLRLAFEEGRATWFGQSVRRYFGLPGPELYVKTTGAPGPGNLDFYFNVETETPYACDGAASEVAVQSALWDINDSADTGDATPGTDDDPLSRPDADSWDVQRSYIPSADNKSLEDFWDGWFTLGKGSLAGMTSAFQLTNVEFYPDASEPNDSPAAALSVPANGTLRHLTYFADANGDGIGEADADYFAFTAGAGMTYTIETQNLWGRANTSLELLAGDGATVVASNDDRTPGDFSSRIAYTPSAGGVLYVRSFHAPDIGVYGSYDLRISGNAPVDADGDGYTSDVDCDDQDPSIHPGAVEVCNGVDDNCAGGIDEGFDVDGDGFTTCAGDCDDGNPSIHPGASEVCNGVDDNCAGGIDEGFDADGDGFTTCAGDCDDGNPMIYPGAAEICDGIDENCDGRPDDGYPDADGDGFASCAGDCDDGDAAVHPGAVEVCANGMDDNCDGLTDAQDPACGTDTVVIIRAEWKSAGKRLTVQATSSSAPEAVLTLVGFGAMSYDSGSNVYTYTKNNQPNPGSVTVSSSKGGSATAQVSPP